MKPLMLLTIATAALSFSQAAHAADFTIIGQDFMPFYGEENGKPAGAFQQLMDKVCAKTGTTCKFSVLPFRRALDMAGSGEVNALVAIGRSPERELVMNMSTPVTVSGYTFFARTGQAKNYTKLEDTKGATVGVYTPSNTAKSLEKQKQALGGDLKVEEEVVSATPFKKLDAGRYGDKGLVYANRAVGVDWAKTNKAKIEPAPFNAESVIYHVGFSKKSVDDATFKKMDEALKGVLKSDEGKKILSAYGLEAHP